MKTKKILALALAAVLLVAVSVSGTMAWLAADTDPVTNTFTTSKVGVELDENEEYEPYKMIPGHTIDKDPTVTLTAGSEDSFVFVKIEKNEYFDIYMTYAVDSAWTKLDSASSGLVEVYWCNMTAGKSQAVLDGNVVTVKESVTTVQMNEANTNQPKLTFTAYAVQQYKDNNTAFSEADAWAAIQNPDIDGATETDPEGNIIP
ncbi:MAG: hypothetical protein E7318_03345 [Clostridiales bacterium]|nr:hypothetical protein [Clostridiales bacterium]